MLFRFVHDGEATDHLEFDPLLLVGLLNFSPSISMVLWHLLPLLCYWVVIISQISFTSGRFELFQKLTPFWIFGSFSSFYKIPYLNCTKNSRVYHFKEWFRVYSFLICDECVAQSAKVFGNSIRMGKASQFQRYPTNINVAGSRFIKANPKPQCL